MGVQNISISEFRVFRFGRAPFGVVGPHCGSLRSLLHCVNIIVLSSQATVFRPGGLISHY